MPYTLKLDVDGHDMAALTRLLAEELDRPDDSLGLDRQAVIGAWRSLTRQLPLPPGEKHILKLGLPESQLLAVRVVLDAAVERLTGKDNTHATMIRDVHAQVTAYLDAADAARKTIRQQQATP